MGRFAIIENDVVTNIAEADYPLDSNWIADDGTAVIGGTWDGQQFFPPEPIQPTVDEYTTAVQAHMDGKARERNYDGILSACTYASSSVPKFAAEGQVCIAWRDGVWSSCYRLLDAVMQGEIAAPSVGELIEILPELIWPEDGE